MNTHVPRDISLQLSRLRPAAGREAFDLHVAALEWSLEAPIIIESEADLESRPSWQGRGLEPFEHQVQNLITFCLRAPVALLADDVGLGKTISAGLILSELLARRKVSRALVVCPKLLIPQWQEELDSKFGILSAGDTGRSAKWRMRIDTPVFVTTYQTARSSMDEIRKASFDMIILDEAHKLRNLHGTAKRPAMAEEIRKALEERVFKYVLMLTATPIQNRLWDLYSLIDLLATAKGHPNPLGAPGTFSSRYLADGSARATRLNAGRRDEFRVHLSNYIVRTRRTDSGLEFPDRKVRLFRTQATDIESRLVGLIGELVRNEKLNGLVQSSIGQALMSSPEALISELSNMASRGSIPADYSNRAELIAGKCPTTGKLTRLWALIVELQQRRPEGWRLIVFTGRKETQRAIGEFLHMKRISFGFIRGGAARENQKTIQGLWADPPEVRVVVSTDAGAEGVNLQVANVLVNYDLPWNPMLVEQRIGRIQRLAAKHATATVVNLVVGGSVEERVVGILNEKLQAVSQSLGDVESILESAGDGIDDEGGFEALIRTLVMESLKGHDVTESLRKAEASIDRGKRLFDEEKNTVEETLGRLDAMHRTGPRAPRIKPAPPRMPLDGFVKGALAADGAQLTDLGDGRIEKRSAGEPTEHIAFDEDVVRRFDRSGEGIFSGVAPKLYQKGKPAFERLAQSWCERHATLVSETTKDDVDIEAVLKLWLKKYEGSSFLSWQGTPGTPLFKGSAVIRSNAAVAHDRLEKLITVALSPPPEYRCENGSRGHPIAYEIDTAELVGRNRGVVDQVLRADPEISAFCAFYEARLREELEGAGGNHGSRLQVTERFTPGLTGSVVGLQGHLSDLLVGTVHFNLDGEGPYEADVEIVAGSGQVLGRTPEITCEISGRTQPATCLARCSVSGKQVLRHLLARSEESGRVALSQYLERCEMSGRLALPDEMDSSAISGRKAVKSMFIASAMSGRLGLPDEINRCAFTGDPVLIDEVETSQVSGTRYRRDQGVVSVVSDVHGHQSEFVRSLRPEGYLLPTEAGTSAVSSIVGRADWLLASEKPPYRRAFEDELDTCQVTGRRLARDELQTSAISGRVADSKLFEHSVASGQPALPDEMVICQESGQRLLPREVSTCSVTGRIVDLRLLGRSELSGRAALQSLLVRCELPWALALPEEVERCQITGKLADTSELDTCSITGRRILKSEMARSGGAGPWYYLDAVAEAALADRGLKRPFVLPCGWLGGETLATELVTCSLSGLRIARSMSNSIGELAPFRALLDGTVTGAEALDPALIGWLRRSHPELAKLKDGKMLRCPNGKVGAICGRVSSGFLGLQTRWVGVVVAINGEPKLMGVVKKGVRRGGSWSQSD